MTLQTERADHYKALKSIGYPFTKHYREYSAAELAGIHAEMEAQGLFTLMPQPQPEPQQAIERPRMTQPPQAPPQPMPTRPSQQPPHSPPQPPPGPPVAPRDPNELAGQRQNLKDFNDPIRTDEEGRIWYQEEVLKPAYPKPRGRRVLKYEDPGVEKRTVRAGDYTETFEISGDPANARPAEVKITLPSYQVGIYKDPRFPFKVVTYNGNNGFSLDDVQDFYGGAELVPPGVKRMYVENVLCYDIRSTVRAVNEEYRRLQLAGTIQEGAPV